MARERSDRRTRKSLSFAYGKALGSIEQGENDEEFGPHGGFRAVLSTPSLDRDGDRLLREEWIEPLPERLPLDIDHGMAVATGWRS